MPDLATAVTVIDACGRAHVPVLLLSDPGMGKSSLVRGIAAADGLSCETVLGSIREPADVAGLPIVTEGGAVLEAIGWAQECERRGAGEILLTSIDRDGVRSGYDLALTRAISDAVSVPVIASGGAGNATHVCAALTAGGADAALVAGILHDGVTTVAALKGAMGAAGIPVRSTMASARAGSA